MSGERNDNVAVVESSGDVFLDLGLELSRTDRLKVDIAREISRTIDAKKMTQAQAAAKLRCGQARVSNIARGRLKGFTVERLLDYLVVLGMDVDVHLRQNQHDDSGTITLHARCARG